MELNVLTGRADIIIRGKEADMMMMWGLINVLRHRADIIVRGKEVDMMTMWG